MPQLMARGYTVDAIIQILWEIFSIRLKLKPQIIGFNYLKYLVVSKNAQHDINGPEEMWQ